jgi:mannan endo-1,4-beta-mannosidase
LKRHEQVSRKLNKPMVLEEFGISRDGNSHNPDASVSIRDRYYERVFKSVYEYSKEKNAAVAGVNFWAWAGEGRPRTPEGIWKAGDNFIGDPPHETQGWYSVYDHDSTTNDIIRRYAALMNSLNKKD